MSTRMIAFFANYELFVLNLTGASGNAKTKSNKVTFRIADHIKKAMSVSA